MTKTAHRRVDLAEMARAAAKTTLTNLTAAASARASKAASKTSTAFSTATKFMSAAGAATSASASASPHADAASALVTTVIAAHGAPMSTLLREAVSAFVAHELESIAVSRAELEKTNERLQAAARAASPLYVRGARDIARRTALVARALRALEQRERNVSQAAHAYVQRFVYLEMEQRRVETVASQLARSTDMRFLPTGSGGGGGGSGGSLGLGLGSGSATTDGEPSAHDVHVSHVPHVAHVSSSVSASASASARGSLLSLARPSRINHAARIAVELERIGGIHSAVVDLMPADMCPRCNVAMQHNQTTQQLVCPMPGCLHWKRFADMTAHGQPYGEDVEYCKYTYRPVTHLDETMRNAEGAETYVVPFADMQRVMASLRAMQIRPEQLTIPLVREVISKLPGIKTDNTVQIYSRLTGRAPRRMTAFMKDQNRILFLQQEEVFRKIASTRTNNPSFPYTLYKNCELLGYWEMLESFSLLRGQQNLATHDAIRAKVCASDGLAWQFIPTVALDGSSCCGSAPSHIEAAIAENARRKRVRVDTVDESCNAADAVVASASASASTNGNGNGNTNTNTNASAKLKPKTKSDKKPATYGLTAPKTLAAFMRARA
jgi:hypothetical protein